MELHFVNKIGLIRF